MPLDPEEFIGVDYGAARVGVARGSSLARIAEPLKTIAAASSIAEISAIAKSNSVTGVVVGLPRSLAGAETSQTQQVRKWVQEAKKTIKTDFYWQDEALTTQEAEKFKNGTPGSDAEAAAVILQDFLDTPKEQRVRC